MAGFFTKKETESKSRPDGKVYSCVSCGLYRSCSSPKMTPYGEFGKGILIVGDNPEELDDQRGIPFQGRLGKSLQRTLKKLGIDLFADCLCTMATICHTDKTPTNYEIECCRKHVLKVIQDRKPKVIILLGNTPLLSVIGHRWKKSLENILKWRGFQIPDQELQAWLCPVYSPRYVDQSKNEDTDVIWTQDLSNALEKLRYPLVSYVEPTIEVITDLTVLKTIKSGIIAFDYETTGLKPHAEGHRIVCASVADTEDHSFVFMMPDTRKERKPFIDLLAHPHILKMAHNMKFEETWSVVRLRQPVQQWMWDSMLAAHVLDNRPGVTGLKFQAYINFGIIDYSSEISPYLQAVDNTNANSLNKIYDLIDQPGGKEKLMHYCALDSIYQYRLAMIQRKLIIPENKGKQG